MEKVITTFVLILVLSFHIPHVQAEEEILKLPENWSADWVIPFADEKKVPETVPVHGEISAEPARYTKYVVATAYSSDTRQTDASPFRPAMAMDFREEVATKGVLNCIAHNDLRLGTKVRFPDLHGNVVYTVCDRMNVRYTGKNRIDFYFYVIGEDGRIDSKQSLDLARANAKSFGVKKKVKMEIL